VPNWVYSLPRSQQLAFLAGYIDADGGIRCSERNNDVLLTSVNESLLKAMHRLAVRCGLTVSDIYTFTSKSTYKGQTTERTGYRFLISGDLTPLAEYSVKVRNNLAPRHYYHRYNSYNGSPLDAHTSEDIGFARIDSITYVGVEDTYDIEVEGVHNFIAEGIIVHNSEVVYHNLAKQWEEKGVIFVDTDTAVREYPDLVKEYFGTVIPPTDNKFAALNSAVWSGGSFVYVPAGVHVDIPLQAYFRINAKNAGQFERTLIIAEEGAFVHYVEGCTAPVYAEEALHSAVVEIIVKRGARVRYTTIQNWSRDVYNLVTKRAVAYGDSVMEWVDGNIGSRVTQKYPSVYLMEPGARGEILSVAFAGDGQHQDTGGKLIFAAPYTTGRITSKSISKGTGRASYRGLVQVLEGAHHAKCNVECDALLLDEDAKTDTYPYIEINEQEVTIGHEARVSKVSDEQIFYLQSRGLKKDEALTLIVSGFIEPLAKQLPMEYAVELNRLIELEMEGSVG
jgi:FeS assembly protein SufB